MGTRELNLRLPNGLVGKGAGDSTIRDVSVRELDGTDEDLLRDDEHARDGNVLNLLVKNVLVRVGEETKPDRINALFNKHFLAADMTFVLVRLRAWSIDPLYRFDYACPRCGKISRHKINLEALSVTEQKDEFRGLSRVSLERDGHSYVFSQLMAEKGALLGRAVREDYPKEKATRELLLQLEQLNGQRVDAPFAKKLPMSMRNRVRNVLDSTVGGIDTTLEMSCRRCAHVFTDTMPVQVRDFFFPGEERSECQTAKPFLVSGTTTPSSDGDEDGLQMTSESSPSESASTTLVS